MPQLNQNIPTQLPLSVFKNSAPFTVWQNFICARDGIFVQQLQYNERLYMLLGWNSQQLVHKDSIIKHVKTKQNKTKKQVNITWLQIFFASLTLQDVCIIQNF